VVNPRLRELAEGLNRLDRAPVRMTGSGSALFRLFDGENGAQKFARRVRDELGLRAETAPLETR
jgi:4-diphosphocytidyl-2C-methyl-D-erythritol kinase